MMEEKRLRWAGRPSKPVGAAQRLWVGSTPALFRRCCLHAEAVALRQHCAQKPLYPLALAGWLEYGWSIERATCASNESCLRPWGR